MHRALKNRKSLNFMMGGGCESEKIADCRTINANPLIESLRKHASKKDYLPVKGLPALFEAVAALYKRKFRLSFGSEDILVGPGFKELPASAQELKRIEL